MLTHPPEVGPHTDLYQLHRSFPGITIDNSDDNIHVYLLGASVGNDHHSTCHFVRRMIYPATELCSALSTVEDAAVWLRLLQYCCVACLRFLPRVTRYATTQDKETLDPGSNPVQ